MTCNQEKKDISHVCTWRQMKFSLFNESTARNVFGCLFIVTIYSKSTWRPSKIKKRRLTKNRRVWNYLYAPSWKTLSERPRYHTRDYSPNNVNTSKCSVPTLVFADKWITEAVAKAVKFSGKDWRTLQHSIIKLKWFLCSNHTQTWTKRNKELWNALMFILSTWDFFQNVQGTWLCVKGTW